MEEARRIIYEFLELSDGYFGRTDDERKRRTQVANELMTLGFDAFPVYYEILEQSFDNPERVSFVVHRLFHDDGRNLASEGKKEALDWARKLLDVYKDKHLGSYALAVSYLARKGDAKDVEWFPAGLSWKEERELLTARVAGTNVIRMDDHVPLLYVIPSVANTGPQGVYVYAIIQRAWENVWEGNEEWQARGGDVSKIPPELLTMVVSFDRDGSPICSLDLAKYGLTMPVIEPKPTTNDLIFGFPNNSHTVTFPPLGETPPQKETDIVKPQVNTMQNTTPISEQPQATPKSRNPLWLGILAFAVISAVTVWSLAKRKVKM